MKRELRVFKDYITIDIVDEQKKVLSTPFRLEKGKVKPVYFKYDHPYKMYKTHVSISDDFTKLLCLYKETGFKWEADIEQLLDSNLVLFDER